MWVLYALLAAVAGTISGAGYKIVTQDVSIAAGAFTVWLFALPFLCSWAFLCLVKARRAHQQIFGDIRQARMALVVSSVLNIGAWMCFVAALRISDFSVVFPLRGIVPIFAPLSARMILGERTGSTGFMASILVAVGILLISNEGRWADANAFLASFLSRGAVLAILSALIFAFASAYDRKATAREFGGMESGIYSALLVVIITIGFGLWVAVTGTGREVMALAAHHWRVLLGIGVFGAAGTVFTMRAFSLGSVSGVTSVLRSQVLFGVLVGGIFFHEQEFFVRMIGGIVLTVGLVLAALRPSRRN